MAVGADEGLIEVRIAAPSTDASGLARLVVEERLAACAQVLPGVTSTYWWEGAVETSAESLVVAKTSRSLFVRLSERVTEAHPYDVPEILAVPIVEINAPYAAWLRDALGLGEGA